MRKRSILLLLAVCTFLPAQDQLQSAAPAAAPKLTIEITSAPPADAGGPDKLATITGRITGECKDCTVILLAKGGPFWYLQPWADGYRTTITDNKTFKMKLTWAATTPRSWPAADTSRLPA